MAKTKPLRVKVVEYGEQQLEALGFPAKMEFELTDGSIVELMHPWLWDDDTRTATSKVESGADLDRGDDGEPVQPLRVNGESAEPHDVRLARAALGAKDHARFIAGGGKSGQIALAIEMMKRRDEVEADPKGR